MAGENDDMNESLKDLHLWKDLLAKPHEWWAVRSKEVAILCGLFQLTFLFLFRADNDIILS